MPLYILYVFKYIYLHNLNKLIDLYIVFCPMLFSFIMEIEYVNILILLIYCLKKLNFLKNDFFILNYCCVADYLDKELIHVFHLNN